MTLVRYYPQTAGHTRRTGEWVPPVDVIEHDHDFTIEVDLPGLEKSDVSLNVHEGVLTLAGERTRPETEGEAYYNSYERPQGTFTRSFRLPDAVDPEKIDATYKNGVLELKLAKKEEVKPRTITVA